MSATAAKSRYLRQMKGDELLQNRLAGRDVAGAGARLDHRRALPVLADAAVVVERGVGRDRDLGRGRIGPQPQIDAEHVAVGGALLQQLHQAARDAHVERRRVVPVHQRRRGRVVEHDQVDVARIVELEGAHLAHGEHDVAAALLRTRWIGRLEPAAADGIAQQEAHRRADGGVGEFGQRARRPHHRPDPADVGERDQQRRLRLHAAKQPHRLGFVLGGGDRLRGLRQQRREMLVGIGVEHGQQAAAGSAVARSQRNGEPSARPASSASSFGEAAIRRLSALPASLRPISPSHSATRARAALRRDQPRRIDDGERERLLAACGGLCLFLSPSEPCPRHGRACPGHPRLDSGQRL